MLSTPDNVSGALGLEHRVELVRVQLWGPGTGYVLGTAVGSLALCVSEVLVTLFFCLF